MVSYPALFGGQCEQCDGDILTGQQIELTIKGHRHKQCPPKEA